MKTTNMPIVDGSHRQTKVTQHRAIRRFLLREIVEIYSQLKALLYATVLLGGLALLQ